MKSPTYKDYRNVLSSNVLSNRQLEILSFLYYAKNSSLTEAELAKICKYQSKSSASFQIGKIGRVISEYLGVIPFEYVPGKPAYFYMVGPYTSKNGWEMNANLKMAFKEFIEYKKLDFLKR